MTPKNRRVSFPSWAAAVAVPLALLAVALLAACALLLKGIPVPLFPRLAQNRELTPSDVVALLVASLTSFLAIATVLLAAFTREAVAAGVAELDIAQTTLREAQRQVKVAQDQIVVAEKQAAVAQASLEASWRPILIDVAIGDNGRLSEVIERDDHLTLSVSLRNAGTGLAIITSVSLECRGQVASGTLSRSMVATGETVTLGFNVSMDTLEAGFSDTSEIVAAATTGMPMVANVGYTDQEGLRRWLSRAHLSARSLTNPPRWAYGVRQVGLYREGDATPLAVSGPSDLSG